MHSLARGLTRALLTGAVAVGFVGGPVVLAQERAPDQRGSRWEQLDPETQQRLIEEWEAKSPEEQEAFKRRVGERRSRWESMSEQEREAAKERRREMRGRWEGMSEEERAEARDEAMRRREQFRNRSGEERQEMRRRAEDRGQRPSSTEPPR